jgi:hypothetical protein
MARVWFVLATLAPVLALQLSFVRPQTIISAPTTSADSDGLTSSPTANPSPLPTYRPTNLTVPSAMHFELFKNSPFLDGCPPSDGSAKSPSDELVKVRIGDQAVEVHKAQVKTQTHFCAHLVQTAEEASFVIVPTKPTPAAFVPSWSTMLMNFVVLLVKFFLIFRASKKEPDYWARWNPYIMETPKRTLLFPSTDALSVAALFDPGSALQICLNNVFVSNPRAVSYPQDAFYQQSAVKAYNTDIPITPAAVTRPATSKEIAEIVRCAVQSKVKVQPRSGGHSYANYCMLQFFFSHRAMQRFYATSQVLAAKTEPWSSTSSSFRNSR